MHKGQSVSSMRMPPYTACLLRGEGIGHTSASSFSVTEGVSGTQGKTAVLNECKMEIR